MKKKTKINNQIKPEWKQGQSFVCAVLEPVKEEP
jgi:hypothetical protein